MKRLVILLVLLASAACWSAPAFAVEPDEILQDPVLEIRARAISREIRCLVCQNQSIDDSNADLAHDLRLLVRERLVAGDSDDEVRQYLVARYGDFILLRPPIRAATYALWFGPAIMLVLAMIAIAVYFQRQRWRVGAVVDLTPDERRRVDDLLARQRNEDGAR